MINIQTTRQKKRERERGPARDKRMKMRSCPWQSVYSRAFGVKCERGMEIMF